MTIPTLTICSLVYNHEPWLKRCLEGFVMQRTSFPFEVLIHDDASTDHSADIIREYEARYPDLFRPIYQSENQYSKGRGIFIPILLPKVQSKYIALCEGDDYWTDPEKLQMQVDFLESHPDHAMVYTQTRSYHESQHRYGRVRGGAETTDLATLLNRNCIYTQTVVMRRDAVERYVADVAPQEQGWRMGDYPMWLYFAATSKIGFIERPTAVYRLLDESASHSRQYEKMISFVESSNKVCRYMVERYAPELEAEVEKVRLRDEFVISYNFKRFAEARDLYHQIQQRGYTYSPHDTRTLRRRYLKARLQLFFRGLR